MHPSSTHPKGVVIGNITRSIAQSRTLFVRKSVSSGFRARLWAWLVDRIFRKRTTRIIFIAVNALLVLGVLAVVLLNPSQAPGTPTSVASSAATVQATVAPVDQLASVAIAVTVARMANLPESAAVSNQADSESIQLAIASADNTIVNKPQLVSTTFLSNKDIRTYVTQANDTLASIASRFGVSSDSITWSNNLTSTVLPAGKALLIPPANGIVYTVSAGDTADSLAQKFHASADKITAFNDAELSGLHVGERIIIPDGKIVIVPVYSGYSYGSSGFAWGSSAIYGFNGYDYGNCTWYVATQIPVPANWGNAATWAAGARAAGWHVSPTPTVGAIAQTPYAAGGLGHVAIVTAVQGDQIQIKDMNNYGEPGGGFGRVSSGWYNVSTYPNYITAP